MTINVVREPKDNNNNDKQFGTSKKTRTCTNHNVLVIIGHRIIYFISDNEQIKSIKRHEPVLTNHAVDAVHDMVVEHRLLVVLTPLTVLYQRLKRLGSNVCRRHSIRE